MIIALMIKPGCHSGCCSSLSYAFIASKKRKHKSGTSIKLEILAILGLTQKALPDLQLWPGSLLVEQWRC